MVNRVVYSANIVNPQLLFRRVGECLEVNVGVCFIPLAHCLAQLGVNLYVSPACFESCLRIVRDYFWFSIDCEQRVACACSPVSIPELVQPVKYFVTKLFHAESLLSLGVSRNVPYANSLLRS